MNIYKRASVPQIQQKCGGCIMLCTYLMFISGTAYVDVQNVAPSTNILTAECCYFSVP